MPRHPRHLPADERRAVTVEAMLKLAARQNPNDITTTAIAQHMGLTQGALFKHFPTKEAIRKEVMAWVAENLLARVENAAQGAASPVAALKAMYMAHVDFVSEHPGVPKMLFSELQHPGDTVPKMAIRNLIHRYGERLRQLLKAGKKLGELHPKLNVDAAAVLFLGSIQGLIMQSGVANDPASIRRNAPKVFAIYLRGIGNAL